MPNAPTVTKLSHAKMTAKEVNAFLTEAFPQIEIGRGFTVEETEHGFARMRMHYGNHLLRPGGTISGPAMFALADVALYAEVLASIGPVAHAVTTKQPSLASPTEARLDPFVLAEFLSQNRFPLLGNSA